MLHFVDQRAECFRKQNQVGRFPSFDFFEIFRLARLRGERAGGETGEGVKDLTRVVTMGQAFQEFAEVTDWRRLPRTHVTPSKTGSRSRRECNTRSMSSEFSVHSRCGSSAITAHLKR